MDYPDEREIGALPQTPSDYVSEVKIAGSRLYQLLLSGEMDAAYEEYARRQPLLQLARRSPVREWFPNFWEPCLRLAEHFDPAWQTFVGGNFREEVAAAYAGFKDAVHEMEKRAPGSSSKS